MGMGTHGPMWQGKALGMGGGMGPGAGMGPGDGPFHDDGMEDDHSHGFFHHTEEVDFERHTFLCIFADEYETDGYAVHMQGITMEADGSFLCHYTVDEPDRPDHMTHVMTQPFLIVAIPKTDAGVQFQHHQ